MSGSSEEFPIHPRLLAILARAFATGKTCPPDRLRAFKRGKTYQRLAHLPGGILFATFAAFVRSALATENDIEWRANVRRFLVSLGIRPSLLDDDVVELLGIDEEREALLAAIRHAFPGAPLVGQTLKEALLRDARETSPEAYARARATDERDDWRRISDDAITQAFAQCSVYIWLEYPNAWLFYLPAFMTYALRHPASRCETFTLDALDPRLDGRVAQPDLWTTSQRACIERFLVYVADDTSIEGSRST